MVSRRRHFHAVLPLAFAVLSAPALMGASCIDLITGESEKERKECAEVCAAEAQCDLGRTEEDCLASLCTEKGFAVFEDSAPDGGVATPVDLQDLVANDCMREAADCATLLFCSCDDSCSRVSSCVGSEDTTCVDTCEALLEQDTALYLENRCKMESTCADLPACGTVP